MGNFFIVALEVLLIGAVGSLFFQKDKELAHLISSVSSCIAAIFVIIFSISSFFSHITLGIMIPTAFPFFTITFPEITPLGK